MFHRNETQRFMDAKFTAPDHKWLMKITCEIDHSGWEKLQWKKLTQYIQQKAWERQGKLSAHLEKAAKRAVELATVDLVFDLDWVNGMTRDQLDDQLDLWQKIDKDVETVKCRVKNKPQKIAEIKAALERREIEGQNITEEDSEDPETVEDDELDIDE
ncbi:hypothetical protein EDD85DRAFT_959866 [Armillaria nabsnona]|nr:hypothetical protein EDD85DRAFT_959866 [Armillaria nabsnona]